MKHLRGLVLGLAAMTAAPALVAQDWVPKTIVAITEYIPLARQARISGDVVVRCFLDGTGSVTRAEVLSGHPLFKDQAVANALLWKFQRHDSTDGASDSVTLTYQYRLDGDRQRGRTTCVVDLPNIVRIVAAATEMNP